MNNQFKPYHTVIPVKCTVIKMDIIGTETHYDEKIWVEDENEDDGGSYQTVKKKYETPQIIFDFIGEVDVDLELKGIYTDGNNLFRAVTKNQIRNYNMNTTKFEIPTSIALTVSVNM